MLRRILAKPSGGWRVVCAVAEIHHVPRRFRVEGLDIVVWRADDKLMVAPDACPHMGASLSTGHVRCGRLVCPWHGLELDRGGHGRWKVLPAFDDGVLLWVRMATEEPTTSAPVIPARPTQFVDAVVQMEARCEPRDVIANRLDPWHGVHFHGHSFARLVVLDVAEESITLRVAYRVVGPFVVEVDATFTCPDPNTIVMTIVDGEGVGSVVETHATAIDRGRTMVTEATLATSDRPGFFVVRRLNSLIRPWMRWAAERLWRDDREYAERTYELRQVQSPAVPKGAQRRKMAVSQTDED
ncbi:MAG: Rieske 2Fe-2S domain-containing protein [Myxococcales bacterium]|nr:Rieske 2Fe-2S domain-containing protein [Myxococcales bacterium]